jgi:hypothetical protein
MVTPWYAVAAICLSVIALFVATKTYLRKAGVLVRGAFSIASSRDCNDRYVSRVILENLKDRAITIFALYLRVGHSYYIEVEDFEEKPLILKPFETYQKEYGPIQFYGISNKRMNLNALLEDRKIAKRLVLSTPDGKYVVPTSMRTWSPIGDFFNNQMTAVVRPIRTLLKEKYIGGNIQHVIEFVGEGGTEEIIPIHPDDYELKVFRNFPLTRDSLASRDALDAYLQAQVDNGKLVCKSYVVHDVTTWRDRANEFYTGKTIEAKYYGLLQYHVAGWLFTRYSDWKLKRANATRIRRAGS